SLESIYMRFFSPVTSPTREQLDHLTHVDYDSRMALVAELGNEIVAVARYDRLSEGDRAEVAFTVQDDQQGRGLATDMPDPPGAGRRPGTIGHEVFANLLAGDFTGPVYPVNPHADVVASVRAYPRILDVPDPVDLAVVTVPAASVMGVVQECADKGVHGLIVIS